MTREEARQFGLNLLHGIVERNKVSAPCYADNVKQAIHALLAPSIPSNLDEAAEKYAGDSVSDDGVKEIAAFNAGTEWMAGQGVKIGETEIYLEDNGDEPPYTQEWLDIDSTEFRIPDGAFKPGDKVEVILRKK